MPLTHALPRVSKTRSTSPWMAVCGSRWRAQWNQACTWPSVRAQADQEVYKREGRQWWQRGIRILSSHLWPSHPRRVNEDLHLRDGKRAWWNRTWVHLVLRSVADKHRDGRRGSCCGAHVSTTLRTGLSLLEDGLMFFNFWGQWWRRCFWAGPRPGILDLGIMVCVRQSVPGNSWLWGSVPHTVECLLVSLASIHQGPAAPLFLEMPANMVKCPLGDKSAPAGNQWSRSSSYFATSY